MWSSSNFLKGSNNSIYYEKEPNYCWTDVQHKDK